MSVERLMRPFLRQAKINIWKQPCALGTHLQSTRRYASSETSSCPVYHGQSDIQDLESASSLATTSTPEGSLSKYDPVGRAQKRNRQLPASRYRFRPPKYYRGPLHPHQPPPPSDPSSRLFQPGPFTLPRLQQTYETTFAPDLMTLAYVHYPPGYQPTPKAPRLRPWDGASPYYKNRPLRGPRGAEVLRLLRKPITFRNVPKLEKVTVHTMVSGAIEDSAHLHVAGMVVQAITNVRATAHKTRKSVAGFGIRKGQHLSVTAELKGEDMYHFLSKCIDVVMPKIKDWRGVKGSSGDSSGNIAFGFTPEDVALFPEVEVNYDAYPPKMIPGCHVTVHTSASNDRDARLLLSSLGIPFYGKQIN
ncbi:ribosomal protein L5 domain-containing protein [Delphinella strobiligena]|nr:ribosomal protein L5 domain-containing protein [Delphinella strobiligena]